MTRPGGRRGGGGRGPTRTGGRSRGGGGFSGGGGEKGCRLLGLFLIVGFGLGTLAILGTAGAWVASFFV